MHENKYKDDKPDKQEKFDVDEILYSLEVSKQRKNNRDKNGKWFNPNEICTRRAKKQWVVVDCRGRVKKRFWDMESRDNYLAARDLGNVV